MPGNSVPVIAVFDPNRLCDFNNLLLLLVIIRTLAYAQMGLTII
ncbi:MAG: hypothetical protein [Olavius algarvensis Delta 4 endosymbiont]|nr:MAG: hypothetical protein [Olavius algarvensis Delta 4 endosymbiont]